MWQARAEADAAIAYMRMAEMDRDAALAALAELRDNFELLKGVAAEERTAAAQAMARVEQLQHMHAVRAVPTGRV
jgi:hypothetical protein